MISRYKHFDDSSVEICPGLRKFIILDDEIIPSNSRVFLKLWGQKYYLNLVTPRRQDRKAEKGSGTSRVYKSSYERRDSSISHHSDQVSWASS